MSSTRFSFKARLRVGNGIVPLLTEVVSGEGAAQDGVTKGFLFRLDLAPGDPPPTIDLGPLIRLVEEKLGVSGLATHPNLAQVREATGQTGKPFDDTNDTLVDVRAFEINSTADQSLFAIAVDVHGSDPKQGLLSLPEELAGWLRVDSVAIAFSSKTQKKAPA